MFYIYILEQLNIVTMAFCVSDKERAFSQSILNLRFKRADSLAYPCSLESVS